MSILRKGNVVLSNLRVKGPRGKHNKEHSNGSLSPKCCFQLRHYYAPPFRMAQSHVYSDASHWIHTKHGASQGIYMHVYIYITVSSYFFVPHH